MQDATLEDYLDAEMVDQDGKLVGTLACFWTDDHARPVFVGIRLARNPKKTTVVPAQVTDIDERQSCVWIKLPERRIEQAPSLDCDHQLNEELVKRLCNYFHMTPQVHSRLNMVPPAR